MTHSEFLHDAVAEITEELPNFSSFEPEIQQTLRELAETYFQAEFVPRLEGMVNIPLYEEAMHERTDVHRAFIADQLGYLKSSIVKAQREAHRQLLEKLNGLPGRV